MPGREEYLDSEKYQIRTRDWQAPGNIIAEIARLNTHPARESGAAHAPEPAVLQRLATTRCSITASARRTGRNFILVAVSLDPHRSQETRFEVPLWEFGLPDDGALAVEELMRGQSFDLVRQDPALAARAAASCRSRSFAFAPPAPDATRCTDMDIIVPRTRRRRRQCRAP